MDPEASELVLPSESPLTGVPSYFTVTTRDQDGKKVYVGDMKVCTASAVSYRDYHHPLNLNQMAYIF